MDKRTFLSRPDISKLSKQEQNSRWKQHLESRKIKTPVARKQTGTNSSRTPRSKNNSAPSLKDPLSECAKLYAVAAMDPWGCSAPPCVPDNINLASYKFASRNRGTFTTGDGTAFVQYSPYNAVQNTTPAIYSTTNAFVGTGTSNSGTGILASVSDSPYAATFFARGLTSNTWRIVGSGLRVRYIGPEQFRGGQTTLYRSPGNAGIANGINAPTLLNDRTTSTAVVDREWHTVVWKPASTTDLAYADVATVSTGQPIGRIDQSGCLMAFVSSVTFNSVFEYDAISWYEVVGNQLPNATPSHSDATGMSAVEAARGQVINSGSMTDTVSTFATGVYDALTHMSGIVTPAMPTLLRFAKNLAVTALTTSGSGLGNTLALGHW